MVRGYLVHCTLCLESYAKYRLGLGGYLNSDHYHWVYDFIYNHQTIDRFHSHTRGLQYVGYPIDLLDVLCLE